MSRGLIVEWRTPGLPNHGVIAGCSPDVHGGFFAFALGDVVDFGLRNMLINSPHFTRNADCSEGPHAGWVFFSPSGGMASGIFRIFP